MRTLVVLFVVPDDEMQLGGVYALKSRTAVTTEELTADQSLDPVLLAEGLYLSSPQSEMVIFLEVRPLREPKASTFLITSIPSFTLPKTTCRPSSLNEWRRLIFPPNSALIHSSFYNWLSSQAKTWQQLSSLNKKKQQHLLNNWTQTRLGQKAKITLSDGNLATSKKIFLPVKRDDTDLADTFH